MVSDKPAIGSIKSIGRRRFNATIAAFGALAIGSSSLPLRSAMAHTPKRGGILKVGCDSSSAKDTMDPAKTISVIDLCRATQVYNRLVEIAPDGHLQPGLAESWEGNATGDEWIVRLRKGVTFHNGKQFGAEDVIYTIRRVLDPEVGSGARVLIADIDGAALKAEDGHTVRIKLTSPNADLPSLLALYQLHVIPDGHVDFAKPVGTGPFVTRSFAPGVGAVFTRNANYWKSDLPYLDEIHTIGIPDPTARFNALLAGDVHAITKLDANLVQRAKTMSEIAIFSTPGPAHATYPMRSDAAPFDSNDVRLALKHALDREKLLELAYAGQGKLGYDHPVPAFSPFYCNEIPLRPYDPDKAKYHLKKAGYEAATFELVTSTIIQNGVEAATIYAEMASKAGVNIKVVQAPADGYWSATWMKKPWAMSTWWGRPTIDSTLGVAYASDAKWNEGAWSNPKFDQILKEARAITDFDRRKQLYWDAQHMLADEGPSVIPVFMNWLDATSAKVKGIESHPMGNLGWFLWDKVWIAA
jgi:peptide/nickel transport system substrate-binding protein